MWLDAESELEIRVGIAVVLGIYLGTRGCRVRRDKESRHRRKRTRRMATNMRNYVSINGSYFS